MDLIIRKLLSDAGILLAELWWALWHDGQPPSHDVPDLPSAKIKSSGTAHPTL